MDCSPPGSSVPGILQAGILARVAISSSRESSWPRDQTHVSYVLLPWQVGFSPLGPPGKLSCSCEVKMKSLSRVWPALCGLMDCSPPGSSVHGIVQARVLEWGAIAFSRASSQPRDQAQVSCVVGRRFPIPIWATREVCWYIALNFEEIMTQSLPHCLRQFMLCSGRKGFPSGSAVQNLPTKAGDVGSNPGSRKSSGEGSGNPLQYSCLGNPTDRGARWATVHGAVESRIWFSD